MKLWSRVLKGVQVTAEASTIGPQPREEETASERMVLSDSQNRILSSYVVSTAQGKAAALISAAQGKSRSLLEEARKEAERIKQQAYEEGYAQGFQKGEQQAQGLIAEAEALLEQARRERKDILRSAEPEIVKLALKLAERVVTQQLDLEPSYLLAMLKEIDLGELHQEVVIRVNPEQVSYLEGKTGELSQIFPQAKIRLEADPRVRQGFVLDTEQGTVDARLDIQFEELEMVLKEVLKSGS